MTLQNNTNKQKERETPSVTIVGHSCSAQLISDWTDASIITIDGIDFAPVGHDGKSGFGFGDEDLDNGLQLRIWEAVKLIASAFGGEVIDCRHNNQVETRQLNSDNHK